MLSSSQYLDTGPLAVNGYYKILLCTALVSLFAIGVAGLAWGCVESVRQRDAVSGVEETSVRYRKGRKPRRKARRAGNSIGNEQIVLIAAGQGRSDLELGMLSGTVVHEKGEWH